jgi:DNA mismatch repair protein MutS
VADRSYGVHVAALAGIPQAVVKRAKHLLQELEKQATNHQPLPLFETETSEKEITAPTANMQALEVLKSLNIDDLTPKTALAKLYELREMIE